MHWRWYLYYQANQSNEEGKKGNKGHEVFSTQGKAVNDQSVQSNRNCSHPPFPLSLERDSILVTLPTLISSVDGVLTIRRNRAGEKTEKHKGLGREIRAKNGQRLWLLAPNQVLVRQKTARAV